MCTPRIRPKSAFTLVELLVVVAILVLLISVLLPALSRARQSAKGVLCMSNLRGLGLAVQFYAHHQQDRLVGFGYSHGGSATRPQGSWFHQLQRDYGNELIARCPSDESDLWDRPADFGRPEVTTRRMSYALNSYVAGADKEGASAAGGVRKVYKRLGAVPRPMSTLHLVELVEHGDFAVSDHVHPETWWSDPVKFPRKEIAVGRHLGLANYVFVDSHVERLQFSQTYAIDLARSRFPKIHWVHNFYDPAIAR